MQHHRNVRTVCFVIAASFATMSWSESFGRIDPKVAHDELVELKRWREKV